MAVYPIGEVESINERRRDMPKSRFFGVVCKCGVPIPCNLLTQEEPVELEELQRRWRQEGWGMKIVVHALSLECSASNDCGPDDVIPLGTQTE